MTQEPSTPEQRDGEADRAFAAAAPVVGIDWGKPNEPERAQGQGRAARRMVRRAQRREAGSFTELCRSAPVDLKLRRLQHAALPPR